MMKSKFQEMDLNLFLALANIIFLLYSCNGNIDKKEKAVIEQKVEEVNISNGRQEKFEYDKENLIKKQSLKIDSKEFVVLFLLDQEGDFGDSNFEKYIDVAILRNNILVDKIEFSNQSMLCDIELLNKSVKVINSNSISNEKLFFITLESCDGEDPDVLEAIIWDGKKQNYSFEIPKYFDSNKSKKKLLNSLFEIEDPKTASFTQTDGGINETILKEVSKLIENR